MNFAELMNVRQSCRSFNPNKKVEKDTLLQIIEEARLSPSACNSQAYKIFAVQNEKAEIISAARVMGMNKFLKDCSSYILIAEDKYNFTAKIGTELFETDFRSIDIGILTANIVNAATDKNIQTCILGAFSEKEILKKLNINAKLRIIIALGYETENYPHRKKSRKDRDKVVQYI
ncbi:nitroreductase family protein [Treponema pedis]|uniref:nitroreductase family protein n=1 Tax=Treponema pedis TaxID=409322 RepID=UPI00040AFFA7|nr:nitroreductase family protein [Treponema pedis]QSI04108.1 nitroreductase [Treponema pedis]